MKSFATRIEIQSPAETVWSVLTELPKWTEWNSTIERTIGKVALGAKVTVFAKQSPGRAFPLRVTALDVTQDGLGRWHAIWVVPWLSSL